MVWLLVLLSLGWSKEGDLDYIDPQASAREIFESIGADPAILQSMVDDLAGSIKTLSRPIWMFHRRSVSSYTEPVPLKGKVSISNPVHRKFYDQRMIDFFHNAEYGRDSYEGSGLYLAPSSSNFDEQGHDYMLAVQSAKGSRFIDYRTGNYFSEDTQKAIAETGCWQRFSLKDLLQGGPVCRAIGVAFARAAKLKFLVYDYGVKSPKGCDQRPAFVMLDHAGSPRVFGWVKDRTIVSAKDARTNFNLTYYVRDFGGPPGEKGPFGQPQSLAAGPFAKRHFFGCGAHSEDNYHTKSTKKIKVDLDYPRKPKKVASCEPVPETERLAAVVHEIVRF